jgi:hypothetical protein
MGIIIGVRLQDLQQTVGRSGADVGDVSSFFQDRNHYFKLKKPPLNKHFYFYNKCSKRCPSFSMQSRKRR